jgi:hypothetical protein
VGKASDSPHYGIGWLWYPGAVAADAAIVDRSRRDDGRFAVNSARSAAASVRYSPLS